MKVLAAIVIPPHLSASGAVNAAIAISQSLQRHCQIDVAIMSDRDDKVQCNRLEIIHRRAKNLLGFTEGWLSNKYRTLFYRSDISELVPRYDLVHIHNPIPALEMRRIARKCTQHRVPYVLTTHGFVEVLGMQSAYQLGLLQTIAGHFFISRPIQYVIEHAQRICCLAPQDQSLLAGVGVPLSKMTVIPNGVDKNYYPVPSAEFVSEVCNKFGLPVDKHPKTPVCFFLANHTRNKGLDILLDAFTSTHVPFCLVVGGKKRDYDYAGYAAKCRRDQRIVFTDALTDQEIRALHHYADLFVFPSRADTLPLVVLEAMAAGRAVLSTRVGGIPFQVDDTCGRLVEPENPTALRQAFEDLARTPDRLKTMGQAALIKVKQQFDWDRSADLTFQVYQQVLGLCDVSASSRPLQLEVE